MDCGVLHPKVGSDDITLDQLLAALGDAKLNLQSLPKKRVYCLAEGNPHPTREWPFLQCLTAELNYGHRCEVDGPHAHEYAWPCGWLLRPGRPPTRCSATTPASVTGSVRYPLSSMQKSRKSCRAFGFSCSTAIVSSSPRPPQLYNFKRCDYSLHVARLG